MPNLLRHVYRCLEEIVAENEVLASLRDSGLERATALDKDIAWFERGSEVPPLGTYGEEYAATLRQIASDERWSTFMCHFYNFTSPTRRAAA